MTSAYPLAWPAGFPRSPTREAGSFKTTLPNALKNVQASLRLLGSDSRKSVEGIVISSNISLGVDRPADPGVAVFFTWDGLQVCIPVDRYNTVAANLQAIHQIVEARRTELRHGSLQLVRASFQGFLALPGKKHWSQVLGISRQAGLQEIESRFRQLAGSAHPDAGGSNEAMAELNVARNEALKERGP